MTAKVTAMERADYSLVLRPLFGETLDQVSVTRYRHPAMSEGRDQDLYFRFQPTGWVQFRTSSEGSGLRINPGSAPEGVDMQELGRVVIEPGLRDTRFAGLVGRAMNDAKLIMLPWSSIPVGVKLNWNERSVLVLNWGDELLVTNQLPDYVGDGNGQPATIEDLPALE